MYSVYDPAGKKITFPIEKELQLHLKAKDLLYDCVITCFIQKERKTDGCYFQVNSTATFIIFVGIFNVFVFGL